MADYEEVVTVGSSVRIRNVRLWDTLSEVTVTIVSTGEGNGLFRLTPRTPLGRALLGHRTGDVVRVRSQAATVEYEVIAVANVSELADGDRKAHIGDVVHVRDGELTEWWRIVPPDMADAMRRWISYETPMARALLGHGASELVHVDRPGGRSLVRILAIESPGEL